MQTRKKNYNQLVDKKIDIQGRKLMQKAKATHHQGIEGRHVFKAHWFLPPKCLCVGGDCLQFLLPLDR